MKEDDKKQEKDNGTIDPPIIKNSTHINIDGSIADNPVLYGALDLTRGASTVNILGATTLKNDYLGGEVFANPAIDISKHGAIYTLTQPQSGILGVNSLGENLLQMKINTIGDARNFLVGVNNIASVFSANNGLLNAIESASAVVSTHGRLMTEAIDRISIPSITNGIELATAYHLDGRQVIKLSESVTTVLAYGQAVQNQLNVVTSSEIFKNGTTVLRDNAIALGKISDHIPLYTGSETITSPFIFEPRTIKTKDVEKALPEVKRELPVKTTEAIELMEYVFDPTTKNDDKRITTTVSELKRALKNMQGSVAMFIQQTTHKVEVTAMPPLLVNIEKGTSNTSKFPFKIPAGTTCENIIIQFKDNNFINIQVAGHSHPTGYADMGFIDGRTNKPNLQWTLLLLLAKRGGSISHSSGDASDNFKKHKQILSEKLQSYFGIEYDPFKPYTSRGGYKIKMTLIPSNIDQMAPSDDNEIEDIFGELREG
jgi:hypothetical protein